MVTAINAGIDEVGGANWKEVLGSRARLQGTGDDAVGDSVAKATDPPSARSGSAAADTVATAGGGTASPAAATDGALAGGTGQAAAEATIVAALQSGNSGGELDSVDVPS